MSIKFLDVSTQRKTGNIPQTYRSGGQDMLEVVYRIHDSDYQ